MIAKTVSIDCWHFIWLYVFILFLNCSSIIALPCRKYKLRDKSGFSSKSLDLSVQRGSLWLFGGPKEQQKYSRGVDEAQRVRDKLTSPPFDNVLTTLNSQVLGVEIGALQVPSLVVFCLRRKHFQTNNEVHWHWVRTLALFTVLM